MIKTQFILLLLGVLGPLMPLWGQASSYFDGKDDKATVYHHHHFNLDTKDFTIEATLREIPMQKAMMTLISKRDNSSSGFALMINTYKGIELIAEIGKDRYKIDASALEDGRCHSIAMRRMKEKVTLFIDDQAYSVGSNARNISTKENLTIGYDGANVHKPFQGYIEEIRFWDIGRADRDIFSWNTRCIPPSTSGLLAYWNMQEGNGQFFHDVAQVLHHAYLGNSFTNDVQDPKWSEPLCLEDCCQNKAHFSVSTHQPFASQWVTFTNTSSPAVSYEWTVNNQVVSNNQHLQHSFAMGVSIVRLKTVNRSGCAAYYSDVIEVTQQPELCQQPTQTISDCTPEDLNNPNTPILVKDNWGNCFTPSSFDLPAPSNSRSSTPGFPNGQACDCGHFRLFFRDVIDNRQKVNLAGVLEGYGFNHPTAGAARRTALCRVYEDISVLLSTTLSSTEKVRIEVRPSDDASNAFMDANVLGLGGSYFVDLNDAFVYGEVAKTIIQGKDSYTDLHHYSSNFATLPHGNIRFRFNTNWNFDLSISPPLSTSAQRDFYAVALHEALHSLGFYSLISSNGNSVLADIGLPNLYSKFDNYLINSSTGNPLISNTATTGSNGQTCMHNSPNLGSINACPNFNGNYANNANHPVYFNLAVGFEPGSSLSHLNCSAPFSNNYIMNKAYTPNRTPNIAEVEVLCDIGYTTTGTFGQNLSPTNNTLATYNNSCSHPCQIIGSNDIIDPSTGNPYKVCRTSNSCAVMGEITIADILANDNGTGNLPSSYECLTIHYGGGQINNPTTTGFSYEPDPLFGGWATLSYVPICNHGGTTVRGSRAYVLIYVEYPPDPTCAIYAPNDCNLVCNGDFDGYNGWRVYFRHSALNNFVFQDINSLGNAKFSICSDNGNPYLHFMFQNEFTTYNYNPTKPMQGITLELSKSLHPGESAILTFRAASEVNSNGDNPALEIYGSEFLPCTGVNNKNSVTCGNSIATCPQYVPFCISNQLEISNHMTGVYDGNSCAYYIMSNHNWNTYTVNFTNTSSHDINHLVIGRSVYNNSCCKDNGRIILDDVELHKTNTIAVPMNINSTISNPNPCVGTTTSITYDICFGASQSAHISSINLSHNLFGSTTMNFGNGGDFDVNGQKTLQLSDFTLDPSNNSYCISLTLELDITGATNQAEDILLSIDAGKMCFTSSTVAQSLNQITPTQALNAVTTLSITPSQTTANVGDMITYTVQMCNTSPLAPPNGDLTGITLDILPQAGLTYNFTAPFLPPYTFDLATNACSTFTFTATVTSDCIAPQVEVAATSSCLPYSQQANPVTIGNGNGISFPIQMNAIPTNMTTGNDGSIYATGFFDQNLNFVDGSNSNSLAYTGTGGFNVFVVKYDQCGFAWAQEIPINTTAAVSLQASPDIEVDANGNVFVAFIFDNTFLTYSSSGGADIAIAKYNHTGTLQWIHTDGGVEHDLAVDLELYETTAGATQIVLAGYTKGIGAAGSPNTNSATIATNQVPYFNKIPSNHFRYLYGVSFIASYLDGTSTATGQWSTFIDGASSTGAPLPPNDFVPTIPSKITIDGSGNIYLAGLTYEDFTFPNKTNNGSIYPNVFYGSSTNIDIDVFTASYSSTGNKNWATFYGDDLYGAWGGGEGSRMGVDLEYRSNNLFLVAPHSYNTASYQTHLVKINPSTGAINNTTSLSNGNGFILHSNLAIDNNNDPIVSSNFYLTSPNNMSIDFYGAQLGGQSISIPSGSLLGWAVEKFSNAPNFEWVLANTGIVPAQSFDEYLTAPPLDIDIAPNGDIYNCLFVNGDIPLNGGTYGPTATNSIGYIARIQDQGTSGIYARQSGSTNSTQHQQYDLRQLSTTSLEDTENLSTKLYPNPSTGKVSIELQSSLPSNTIEQISLYDVTGRKLKNFELENPHSNKFELDLTPQQTGVYMIEMIINQQLIRKPIVLIK